MKDDMNGPDRDEEITALRKSLDEEKTRSVYYQRMAEEKGKRHLAEITEISDALAKNRQTEKELRESEERYRIAIEHSHDGVAIIRDGVHIYANRRLVEIFGYGAPEDLLGQPAVFLVHEDEKEKISNYHAMRLKGEATPDRYEFKGVKKDGALVYIEAVVSTIAFAGKSAILAYLRDIGDRRRLEEELFKASKLESLGILAGGIAHDFNNIMTAIMGNISLAKMTTKPDDPSFKRLAGAEQAVNRAKDLTQQLLTFSKGGAPIKRTTGITHILEDSTNFTLTGSNVRCFFSLPEDLWNVDVDEGQVSQVIQNLVINAKEAMPTGGTIEVKAENLMIEQDQGPGDVLPGRGSYIRVTIMDHGIGIPEEYVDKIFDPFFTTKQRGSGLGLATSYSIIRKHGGYIEVKSHLGIGTTFIITLPATQKKNPLSSGDKASLTTGKGRILLMDDEEIVRDTIGEMLGFLGYETECAKDGVEAIDLYVEARKKAAPFDLVILDLTIPGGMGGEEAMEELVEIDPGIKAVVSSGYANNRIMSDFTRYGFVDMISKPYKLEELSETLARVLRKAP
ncbi:MAG TPA: ATP-binding protein [Syntrophorhabdaceae bacterium]|jgi:PAS domain S-box-containing protein